MDYRIVRQTNLRSNLKLHLDEASSGTVIIVPRTRERNVVIISEEMFTTLQKNREKPQPKPGRKGEEK